MHSVVMKILLKIVLFKFAEHFSFLSFFFSVLVFVMGSFFFLCFPTTEGLWRAGLILCLPCLPPHHDGL